MKWGKRCLYPAALALCGWSFHVWAAGTYFGEIELVEQYGGPAFSTAMCFIAVPSQAVQTKPACASGGAKYHFAWECDDPKRKGMLGVALAAYLSGRRVQLIGSGQCSPHPDYENLDFLIVTENP